MQGPRTALHRPRLARLQPPQGLRLQRRQEDGAYRRGLCEPQLRHHPGWRPERRMARPQLQGQVRWRDPHGDHLLRHP